MTKHLLPIPLRTALALLLASSGARATDFYVDPAAGNIANDGSPGSPWSTLEEVETTGLLGTTVKAGDTVHLLTGYHGEFNVSGGSYSPAITILGDVGQTPRLRRVRIDGASGLVLRGLSISPSHAPTYTTVTMFDVGGSSSGITLEDSDLFSEADVSSWGATEWIDRASSGVDVSGDDVTIRRNSLRNVRFGISATGQRALIDHNTIDGFSADGLRGLGDDEVFQYNVVKNVYVSDSDGDANHDDGFQSWSVGPGGVGTGEVRGMVLRGNLILNYEDPAQPLRNSLQGIGCFDGTFVDWVVENNVVITDHWHGITLLGARNSRIVNNTVLDVNDGTPGPPWISIDAHKDGTPPSGCIVRNNLATDFANASTGVTEDHNTVIDDPFALFVDPAAHDLHLLSNAAVIDQGSSDLAPAIDRDGISRPQGNGMDLGAFEWHDASVAPPDGGMSAGGTSASGGGTSAGGGSAGGTTGAGTAGTTGATTGGGTGGGSGGASPTGSGATTAVGAGGTSVAVDGGTPGSASSGDSGGCGCRTSRDPSREFVGSAWILALVAWASRRTARGRL